MTPHSIVRSPPRVGSENAKVIERSDGRDDDRRREGGHGGDPGCGHAPRCVHVAVALDRLGRRLGELSVPTMAKGYESLVRWAKGFGAP